MLQLKGMEYTNKYGRRVWTPNFDMTTIPAKVFQSEKSRRAAKMRKTYSGGVMWSEHNPDTTRCRCAECMAKRTERRTDEAGKPKRPRGRPPKNTGDSPPEVIDIPQQST